MHSGGKVHCKTCYKSRQSVRSRDIVVVLPQYSDFSTGNVNMGTECKCFKISKWKILFVHFTITNNSVSTFVAAIIVTMILTSFSSITSQNSELAPLIKVATDMIKLFHLQFTSTAFLDLFNTYHLHFQPS